MAKQVSDTPDEQNGGRPAWMDRLRRNLRSIIIGGGILILAIVAIIVLVNLFDSGTNLRDQLEFQDLPEIVEVFPFDISEDAFLRYSRADVLNDYLSKVYYVGSAQVRKNLESDVESLIRRMDQAMRQNPGHAVSTMNRRDLLAYQAQIRDEALLSHQALFDADKRRTMAEILENLNRIQTQLVSEGILASHATRDLLTISEMTTALVLVSEVRRLEETRRQLMSLRPVPSTQIRDIERQIRDRMSEGASPTEIAAVVQAFQRDACQRLQLPMLRLAPDASAGEIDSNYQMLSTMRTKIYYQSNNTTEVAEFIQDNQPLFIDVVREVIEQTEPEKLLYSFWKRDLSQCIVKRANARMHSDYRGDLKDFSFLWNNIILAPSSG